MGDRKKTALADIRIAERISGALLAHGIETLPVPSFDALPPPVASHPDMLFFKLGDILISPEKYISENRELFRKISVRHPELRIIPESRTPGSKYPDDTLMNALAIGGKLFCRTAGISRAILDVCVRSGMDIIDTKQGYAACTVMTAGDRAVTADEGMCRILRREGFEVLLIHNGGVSLPPYEYGFIGGASGFLENKLYFIGDIDTHPDCAVIKSFISEAGAECISLSDGGLFDGGRLIFL